MTGFSLSSLVRSLSNQKLFAVLNIGGLALAIALFVILISFVRYEYNFDRVLDESENLWLVQELHETPGRSSEPLPYTLGNLLPQLEDNFPDIEGSRLAEFDAVVLKGGTATAETVTAVDESFFQMFRFPALSGEPGLTLTNPDGIILTRRAALRHFGTTDVLGRSFRVNIHGTPYTYTVGAVLEDLPRQLTYSSDFYIPIVFERFGNEWWDQWGSASLTTVLKFPDRDAAGRFREAVPAFLDRQAFPSGRVKKGEFSIDITPLPSLHLAADSDGAMVAAMAAAGVLTLLIAVMNYINLATAGIGLRAREVALRKVMGATRRLITMQFMFEALATVTLAAVLGLLMAELALPFLNATIGTSLDIEYLGPNGVLWIVLVTIVVAALIAGAFPARVLAGMPASAVLASARTPGGGRSGTQIRQALVVLQFAIAITFAIGTLVMMAQIDHVRSADLGFKRGDLTTIRNFNDGALKPADRREILRSLAASPGVSGVTVAQNAPGEQLLENSITLWRASDPSVRPSLMQLEIGPDYFETFGGELVAGRLLDPRRGEDDIANSDSTDATGNINVVVNGAALRELGISDAGSAIGTTLLSPDPLTIVGIVDDIRFDGPREPVRGSVYMLNTDRIPSSLVTVRHPGVATSAAAAQLEAVWRKVAPNVPFDSISSEQNLWANFYEEDQRRAYLFLAGSIISILIACIGLYGLSAFDTNRRMKEVAIRKTLGASKGRIRALLVSQFLKPVLIANVIAWPLIYVLANRWLEGFDDGIDLPVWPFPVVAILAAAIAVGTVLSHSRRVANSEPAAGLRYE